MWLYMYATVFVWLSTHGVKKIENGGTYWDQQNPDFLPVRNCFQYRITFKVVFPVWKSMVKIANIDVFLQKKVVIYDDLRGRLFMFCW